MKLTVITCTHERPEALALCERYLKRQTRQPDQWLVLDGPEPMPKKVLQALQGIQITGDAIVFIEDDDWYRADYLAWISANLELGYDMIGEGMAAYYHVGHRWWSECGNVRHAALCQTAISRELFEPLANVIESFHSPFFDTRIWEVECNKRLALPKNPSERRVLGIKGMPGRVGYSGEHAQSMPPGVRADPSLLQLWRWIGADALNYAPFKR